MTISTTQWLEPQSLQRQLSDVLLVDVREPGEFRGERIATAVSVPLSSFKPEAIPTSSKTLVLMCQSGNRSRQAAAILEGAGIRGFYQLKGGLNAWKAAELPIVKGNKAPISIMRQVQITAGSLVLIGTVLGAFVSPAWLFLSGFVGAGLVFAGVSNTCGMALILARMPWNQ